MEPIYIEGLNTRFFKLGAYPGLSFHERNNVLLFFMRYVFSTVASLMMFILLITVIYSLAISNSMNELMEFCYIGSADILLAVRTFYFYLKRDKICKCFEVLKIDFLQSTKFNMSNSKHVYKKGIEECNLISSYWTFFLYTNSLFWLLQPIAYYLYDIFIKHESYVPGTYRILPIAYPFTVNHSPLFEILTVYEACLVILMIEEICFHDLTFTCIGTMICTQVNILHCSLISIKNTTAKLTPQVRELEAYQHAVDCIQDHQKIIRYILHII